MPEKSRRTGGHAWSVDLETRVTEIGRHLRIISAERHGGYAYAAVIAIARFDGKAVGNRWAVQSRFPNRTGRALE